MKLLRAGCHAGLTGLTATCLAFACTSGPTNDATEEHDASPDQVDASTFVLDSGSDSGDSSNPADGATGMNDAALLDAGLPDASRDAILTDAAADADADLESDAQPSCTTDPVCIRSSVRECTDAGLTDRSCANGCTEGACNTTCDPPTIVIDQSQADDHANLPAWQTFKVSVTGVLTALELRPNVYSPTGDPSVLTLSVYVGDGLSGERLGQEQYTLPSASGAPFHTFTLATPIPLQGGETYTWEITGGHTPYYATSDVYANGHASQPKYDMVFKAHVATCH